MEHFLAEKLRQEVEESQTLEEKPEGQGWQKLTSALKGGHKGYLLSRKTSKTARQHKGSGFHHQSKPSVAAGRGTSDLSAGSSKSQHKGKALRGLSNDALKKAQNAPRAEGLLTHVEDETEMSQTDGARGGRQGHGEGDSVISK